LPHSPALAAARWSEEMNGPAETGRARVRSGPAAIEKCGGAGERGGDWVAG